MKSTERHILAIDQSTSSTKVMLFDCLAELKERVSISHGQTYPQPGFVEHDPEEIFNNTLPDWGGSSSPHASIRPNPMRGWDSSSIPSLRW